MNFPLRVYDDKFSQDVAYRFSAGVFFLGLKELGVQDTIIPRVIQEVYQRDETLQQRYPDPRDLSSPDNLMTWAKKEGRSQYVEIARYFDTLEPFSKYWVERPFSRPWLEGNSAEELSVSGPPIPAQPEPSPWWKLPLRALEVLKTSGPKGLTAGLRSYIRRWALRL